MRFLRSFAAAAVVAGLLAACSTTSSSGGPPQPSGTATPTVTSAGVPAGQRALARFYRQRLAWKPCGTTFSCARLTVPEDYAKPGGRTLSIAVIRDHVSSHVQGSLIVNPGGPGGSGVQFVRDDAAAFRGLLQHFDLVSFDPRGVGQSAPIRCVSTAFLDHYLNLPPAPATQAQLQTMLRYDHEFAAACAKHNGSLLRHVGTIDAARDMDVLRAALGDKRLTYYGASYGTYLGAKYAQLFPHRIRAMILDGAVNPAQPTIQGDIQQAVGFETDLHDFLAYCANSANCPLGDSPASAYQGLLALAHRVATNPEPVGGRVLGPGNFFNGLASGFYASSDWPELKVALKDVQRGNGAPLLQDFADSLYERNDRTNTYSNLAESNLAINCVDRPAPKAISAYRAAAKTAAAKAPFFGPGIVWSSLPCAFWPAPPVENTHPVNASGASEPILVMGTTHDPATPYAQAVALTRQLGRARLLTLDGDGHTAFLRFDPCIDAAGDAYLLHLTLPPQGTTCH